MDWFEIPARDVLGRRLTLRLGHSRDGIRVLFPAAAAANVLTVAEEDVPALVEQVSCTGGTAPGDASSQR
ncbi:hypothetical protein [Saccharopolyspora cebuensis]|uniref:hypothetical protein n=1 Tax=Saccharopolyspora cebuensis TaxID=418759 RepID=UPI0031EDBA75